MITAWRITKKKFAQAALSGEGAELAGGRWNSPGTRVVYTSSSISLALLEILVHVQKTRVLSAYLVIPARFQDHHLKHLDGENLTQDWDTYPPSASTQTLGDKWVEDHPSLVLEVPSVIVPLETNYLINPAHPAFEQLDVGDPFELPLDARLFGG
mgnify:FL=1